MASVTPSPCISICSLDEEVGLCTGCWRTGEEVERWPLYTEEQKKAVLEALKARKAQFPDLGSR